MDQATDDVRAAADIDERWLTDALHASGVGTGAEITAIERKSIGTGQVGENVRFSLTWSAGVADAEDLPASVVGKFPSLDPASRQGGIMTRTYEREVGFYRDLRGDLDVRAPQVFHVGWAPEREHDFTILMEDLGNSVQGDQITGCTVAEAQAAIDEIVGLHAPTWNWMARDEAYDWLDTPGGDTEAMVSALLGAMYPMFVERYTGRISDDDLALGAEVIASHGALVAATKAWAEAAAAWCVVHGDYRLDNLLFAAGDGAPPVCVVDWQTAAVGSGPADVAYFLSSALAPDVRAEIEVDLVARYTNGLVARGVDIAEPEVWDGYVLGSASCMIMAVFASQAVGRTERGDEMFAVMAEGSLAQVRHLGLLDRL